MGVNTKMRRLLSRPLTLKTALTRKVNFFPAAQLRFYAVEEPVHGTKAHYELLDTSAEYSWDKQPGEPFVQYLPEDLEVLDIGRNMRYEIDPRVSFFKATAWLGGAFLVLAGIGTLAHFWSGMTTQITMEDRILPYGNGYTGFGGDPKFHDEAMKNPPKSSLEAPLYDQIKKKKQINRMLHSKK